MMTEAITLSQREIHDATEFAAFIDRRNERQGKKHLYGFKGSGRANHILGALAERAVAKYLDFEWKPSRAFVDRVHGDVFHLEVRASRHPRAHLIVHPSDPDERVFVLVTVLHRDDREQDHFHIRGWITAEEAKQYPLRSLKAGYDPSHNVPARDLHPAHILKESMRG